METITDNELIKKYLSGDEHCLELLFSKYLSAVYFFASSFVGAEEANDVVQEAFVKVWRKIGKFKNGGNFKAWLFTITRNTAIDYCRRRREIPFSEISSQMEEGEYFDVVDDAPSVLDVLEKEADEKELDRTLDYLGKQDRLLIFLRHKEDLKFEEMAKIMKEPLNTVKSRYRRALLKLKNNLHQK